ncbi:hypothetical protein Hanom_Chr00s195866g01836441 [Helianthus anomalus]
MMGYPKPSFLHSSSACDQHPNPPSTPTNSNDHYPVAITSAITATTTFTVHHNRQ